ncbi:GlxA family transcriptional regulator [Pseudonocardia spinosispora]|uniref:GlxA family transcriptional regulator n=1 Tax=Pseudonocardia spinosispora TaxID=103441 RepID=UPI0004074E2A|nr:helix-turn-helix domain-containing protein [Pseudonocardia spinosispora]
MRQKIVVVVPEDGSLFEIATPLRVWGRDPGEPDWPDTELVACGTATEQTNLANQPLTLGGLCALSEHVADADMVIVPTWPIDVRPVPRSLLDALREAHTRGSRIVGLCLGAFALAEAGLLDGHRAVTHWRYADDFARRFPDVVLDRAPLYVDDGSVVTSAGSAAAIDCCLHLVRRDHGADAAALVARSLVTAPHRSGGQSQFAAVAPLSTADDRLGGLLSTAAADIRDVRCVADLVERSAMSRRSLERLFHARLGSSPGSWLTAQRVQTARELLEGSDLSVEAVAEAVGFGSVQALRREFKLAVQVSPTTYRRAFRAPA